VAAYILHKRKYLNKSCTLHLFELQ